MKEGILDVGEGKSEIHSTTASFGSKVKKALPHLLLLSAQLCFSGWHIIGSVALTAGADALVFALYREILASICMYIFALIKAPAETRRLVMREDIPRFIFLGFCSFINVVGTIVALQYISPSRYAMMQPAIPCFATLISILVGLEGFTMVKAAGILAAVTGAVIIEVWKTGNQETSSQDNNITIGMILVLLQTFAMANVVVFQKSILARYDPTVVTFVFYGIGTLFTTLLCICWESRFKDPADFLFHSQLLPWLALGYATIFATLFSYNAISWAGKRLSPSITTVYCTFQPLGTVILSFLLLNSTLTLSEGIGGACVIAGLIITVLGRQRELTSSSQTEEIAEESIVTNSLISSTGIDVVRVNASNYGEGTARYHILDEEEVVSSVN